MTGLVPSEGTANSDVLVEFFLPEQFTSGFISKL